MFQKEDAETLVLLTLKTSSENDFQINSHVALYGPEVNQFSNQDMKCNSESINFRLFLNFNIIEASLK